LISSENENLQALAGIDSENHPREGEYGEGGTDPLAGCKNAKWPGPEKAIRALIASVGA
jgi:hypothetical protein